MDEVEGKTRLLSDWARPTILTTWSWVGGIWVPVAVVTGWKESNGRADTRTEGSCPGWKESLEVDGSASRIVGSCLGRLDRSLWAGVAGSERPGDVESSGWLEGSGAVAADNLLDRRSIVDKVGG